MENGTGQKPRRHSAQRLEARRTMGGMLLAMTPLWALFPSLGLLLRNARNFFLDYPYLLIEPAVIVSLITVTFYLVGNAVSDAADPRNHV